MQKNANKFVSKSNILSGKKKKEDSCKAETEKCLIKTLTLV